MMRETMMMPNLPPDLIVEILSRVPATSLRRLRFTCKRWNALFKDQIFSEEHFRKAPKESLYLMVNEHRICSISVDVNVVPPSIEFKGGFGLKDPHSSSEEVDIAQVFHCDGFLLCDSDDRPVVWNPCSGETRWIQKRTHHKKPKRSKFALGYTNDKSCRSYKILRSWRYNNPRDRDVGSEIYEFNSNSWRVIDDMDTSCFIFADGSLSLKGNTYWFTYDFDTSRLLICFDFTTERSKRLCLPPSQTRSSMNLSVVREEQLSVLVINTVSSKMEMWVTNNNVDAEADLSWNKSFELDLFPHSKCVTILSSLIIDEEKKVVMCITPPDGKSRRNQVCIITGDNKYYKEFPVMKENQWKWSRCNFYVPSLLLIEQKKEEGTCKSPSGS